MVSRMFNDIITTLAARVIEQAVARDITLVTAESCTGGLIAAALTAIPGSSAVVMGGFVTYANALKQSALGVSSALLDRVGAVSQEVALAMTAGALNHSPAQLAVATTGIAGPGGGSLRKPVGLVHIAVQLRGGKAYHNAPIFMGDRDAVREQSVILALEMVLEALNPRPV